MDLTPATTFPRRLRGRLRRELGRRLPARDADGAARVAELEAEVARLRERNARLRTRVARLEARRDAGGRSTARGQLPGVSRLELRRQCALEGLAVPDEPSILEIGPAHNAIFPKREGYRTRTVDYLDREGLVERYRDFPQYSPDDIEEVDFVLPPGAAMADVIDERFDVVVASHVLEHTTSLVDFLAECERLLTPGGRVALVVPDHRYCFDRFRERTSLGSVIDAAGSPARVHTVGSVVEERLYAVLRGDTNAWGPRHRGEYRPVHGLGSVLEQAELARAGDHYIDTHHWVFTPHHLRLLLHDLQSLGLVRLRESSFHDTVRHEFFLTLSLDGPGPGLTREELLVLADDERRSLDAARFRS